MALELVAATRQKPNTSTAKLRGLSLLVVGDKRESASTDSLAYT